MEKYEEQDTTNKQVLLANIVVSLNPNDRGGFCSNEYQLTFKKYSTKLQEAYYILARYYNFVPAQFPMHRMLDGMQISNALTIDMAKSRVLENILGYFLGSVSYMSDKVVIQFPPSSGGGSKCKGDCRISKFNSNIGRGGGRGKCHGRGIGCHGGHHSGSDRQDPANGWFHVVDCSKSRRSFSGKEFDKARSNGRLYVFNN